MELKKSLGQHFLHDQNMLQKIADAIGDLSLYASVLEIGPGHGALTRYMLGKKLTDFKAVEIDRRCIDYLKNEYPQLTVVNQDFLKTDLTILVNTPACVVGNFPYNISSQIVFKIIEHRELIFEMVGMFQKEMAVRIAAKPNSKDYGVIGILAQAYYDCEYLFDVPPGCFTPPPKVMSGILRMKRKNTALGCDEKLFRQIVKQAFTQRRKMMSNSLKSFNFKGDVWIAFASKRPEQLGVQDFVTLTNALTNA
ncbi:MAG: ribosomal RNA small subunit methyltransferase A [Chitinophagales bacterium]|nr:ribosomal RNA small subunit methyltransferase A [Chitinophagales bacterium]